jgi:hypothetical protein
MSKKSKVSAEQKLQQSEPEPVASSKFRNRNVEVRKVKASELKPHPKNPRLHPLEQSGALKGSFQEVGFVGTLIARETADGLQLLDGHLRAQTMEDDLVDVTIVDLDDKEVELLLAIYDPVGQLAETDARQLDELIQGFLVSNGELASMLSVLMDESGGAPRDPKLVQINDEQESDCEYPLTPVFNERYEFAVIFCCNDTEWGGLQTLLELDREKSYKTTGVAVGRVVPFMKFLELWDKRNVTQNSVPDAQPVGDDSQPSGDKPRRNNRRQVAGT